MASRPRLVHTVLLTLLVLPWGWIRAEGPVPRPPCDGGPPVPPYPDTTDASPKLAIWHGADLSAAAWQLPAACGRFGTSSGLPTLALALTGAFHHTEGADALLARFGRISAVRGVRYWSVTDRRWQPLITEAAALSGPDPGLRRPDFTPAELKSGGGLYFALRGNRFSGEVLYRLHAHVAKPERLIVTVENVTPVRFLLLTVFAPGDLRSTYVLQPIAPGIWGYYALVMVRTGRLAIGHEASYANRAVALYRHTVGIPTDLAPPPVLR
jgi:hypothetical protein